MCSFYFPPFAMDRVTPSLDPTTGAGSCERAESDNSAQRNPASLALGPDILTGTGIVRAGGQSFSRSSSDAATESMERDRKSCLSNSASVLSPELADHYARHNVDGIEDFFARGQAGLVSGLCRFVRLNPRFDSKETLDLLKAEISSGDAFPTPVPWIHKRLGFYAIPAHFKLSQSQSFRSGRVYGMDVTSGAAVSALLFDDFDSRHCGNPGTHKSTCTGVTSSHTSERKENSTIAGSPQRILDLCCSPGLKLCAIADSVRNCPGSSVTGVDISESRMNVTKAILKKYRIGITASGGERAKTGRATEDVDILLYCMDGTTFGTEPLDDLVFHSAVAEEHARMAGKRKRMNKSARARERKRLRQLSSDQRAGIQEECGGHLLFDRVLVDAECSTDGALRHLSVQQQKQIRIGDDAKSKKRHADRPYDDALRENKILTDADRFAGLVDLQQRLIASGYRLLKPGGVLVYSTCSFSTEQNEGIVSWLLKCAQDACLIPVSFPSSHSSEGSIPGTCRFSPNIKESYSEELPLVLGATGFFLAKIKKKVSGKEDRG